MCVRCSTLFIRNCIYTALICLPISVVLRNLIAGWIVFTGKTFFLSEWIATCMYCSEVVWRRRWSWTLTQRTRFHTQSFVYYATKAFSWVRERSSLWLIVNKVNMPCLMFQVTVDFYFVLIQNHNLFLTLTKCSQCLNITRQSWIIL